MVEQQWEAFGEDLVVAQLRGGEAEERAEQVWRYLQDRGIYSLEWVRWAEAADEAAATECYLGDAKTEVDSPAWDAV